MYGGSYRSKYPISPSGADPDDLDVGSGSVMRWGGLAPGLTWSGLKEKGIGAGFGMALKACDYAGNKIRKLFAPRVGGGGAL